MAQYTDYNGITLYKGSKRLDIGCTDNLQTKIPVIIKPANSKQILGGIYTTELYPNKCYWLTNITKNGTINITLLDPIATEKNKIIGQNIPAGNNAIETVSSWVQSDYTEGVVNHNSIKRIVNPDTVPEGVDIDGLLNNMLKATETPIPESSPKGDIENEPSRNNESSPKGYVEGDTGTPIISAKYDSRYKAEHLKNEISDVEFPPVPLDESGVPEEIDTPHILVEYYFIFTPNGSNTISLPNGYYFADDPQNMTFEQDENGPTVYEVHICNNIVRIGKAIKFGRSPIPGGGMA